MYRNYKTFSIYVSRRVHKKVFEQSTLFAILNNPRYSVGPFLRCIILQDVYIIRIISKQLLQRE